MNIGMIVSSGMPALQRMTICPARRCEKSLITSLAATMPGGGTSLSGSPGAGGTSRAPCGVGNSLTSAGIVLTPVVAHLFVGRRGIDDHVAAVVYPNDRHHHRGRLLQFTVGQARQGFCVAIELYGQHSAADPALEDRLAHHLTSQRSKRG